LPNQLINNAIKGASQAVLGQLPKASTISNAISKTRKKNNHEKADPKSLEELVIPDSFRQYEGEEFLLIDTGADDSSRILVFGRQSHENWSAQVKQLYMDGTFKVNLIYIVNLIF